MQANNTDWRAMRELIAQTGMTQLEISVRLGVSLRTINSMGSPARKFNVAKRTLRALKSLAESNNAAEFASKGKVLYSPVNYVSFRTVCKVCNLKWSEFTQMKKRKDYPKRANFKVGRITIYDIDLLKKWMADIDK